MLMETGWLQMIWQPNRLQRRRILRKPTLPPLGLRNLGNTCYLNSVLQCLTYTPPLANFCLSSQHTSLCSLSNSSNCPFCLLERRISRSLTLENASIDAPYKIHNNLTIFADHFRFNRQEDAHEFLRYVIDACHNACVKVNKLRGGGGGEGEGESVVKEIFGGELRSQVKCVSCGGESNKIDEIMDVSLDLFQITSVNEALQKFFQAEVLNGTNKYQCDNCKKLVVARKQLSILKAPNILVIQLKRFEGIHGGKIDRAIGFEECLVLSNYMCKESQDAHPEYNLFGTIVHSGYSPESGHYYAYVKDATGRWYCCNDSIVSLSSLQEVLSEKVYILFFTRTNQRPRSTKSLSVNNGVKPHSNGYDPQSVKKAVSLKSEASTPHGAHNSENAIPLMSSNGKVPPSPRIKFGNFIKDLHGNGNGKGNGFNNGYVKNHTELKEAREVEKNMNGGPLIINTNGATENGFACAVDSATKQRNLLPHGNGETQSGIVKPIKTETSQGHIVVNGMRPDSGTISHNEDSSAILGSKRTFSDVESSCPPLPDASQVIEEKIDEKLLKDASSHLRSCGWYDEVYDFMLAKKKLRAQAGGDTTNGIDIKKLLIGEAKRTFTSQVPGALKAHLIKSLEIYHQRKRLRGD